MIKLLIVFSKIWKRLCSKMRAKNDQLKLLNDPRLATSTRNPCTQGSSNENLGVGANAASEVDMTFVANGPLCELVWSADKGLSLRCAGSLPERKPSPLWATVPSDMVLPPQNINIERDNDILVKHEDMISLQTTFPQKTDVGAEAAEVNAPQSNDEIMQTCRLDSGHRSGSSKKMEGVKNDPGVYAQCDIENVQNPSKEEEGVAISNIRMINILETGEAKWPSSQGPRITGASEGTTFNSDGALLDISPAMLVTGVSDDVKMRNSLDQNGTDGHCRQKLPIEKCHLSELHALEECKHPDPSSSSFGGKRHKESDTILKEVSKATAGEADTTSIAPLDKTASTALNYLQPSIKVASDGNFDCRNDSCNREEQAHLVALVASEASPTTFSVSHSEREGKGKALLDGHVKGRTSRGNDDSDESVESCNSSAVFGGEKKSLFSFEQPLIVCNRLRQQSQESPGSASLTRHENSFMNWISNMVHGVAYKKGEVPSVALIHVPPTARYENKRYGSGNENQVLQGSSIGFTSFFRGLYLPKPELQDGLMMHARNQTQQTCGELDFFKMPNYVSDFPSGVDNQDIPNANILYNVSHDQFPEDGSGGLIPNMTSDKNCVTFQHVGKGYSSINRYSFDPASGAPREGISHHSSLGKRKTSCSENDGSNLPSDVNARNIVNRGDPLHSLWITRFSSKTPSPVANSAPCKKSTGVELERCTDSGDFLSNFKKRRYSFKDHNSLQHQIYSSADPLNATGMEVHNRAVDNEANFCLRTRRSPKISPHELSQRFRCSETLASVFSQRLDALKHISASESFDSSGQVTCFYCGIKGHDLQDCSELTEHELEELLYNIRAAEESPCFCIRCFQLDHWAVACPNASLREQYQTESGGVCLHRRGLDHQLDKMRAEINSQLRGSLHCKTQGRISSGFDLNATCHERPSTNACLDMNHEMYPTLEYSKRGFMSDLNLARKGIGLPSVKRSLQASSSSHLCNDRGKISDVPGRIFNAIKRLRLTRMEVLKWINSAVPTSQLDGYYLRLRLGKLDQEIGVTGYHVACITGAQGERSTESSNKSIFANVGGIRCLVESQYISNQDFQEDELVAWWSATCKAGGKLPSEEDLGAKVKERVQLGL